MLFPLVAFSCFSFFCSLSLFLFFKKQPIHKRANVTKRVEGEEGEMEICLSVFHLFDLNKQTLR